MNGEDFEHESYGMASFSHVSGSTTLFGSEFNHQHYVTLSISRGVLHRDLSNDWYFDRGQLIEVAMSEAQFVQLISRPNMGAGVPVTLTRVDGKQMADVPARESMQDRFSKEIKKDAQQCVSGLRDAAKDLREAIDTGKISKTSLRAILEKLTTAERAVSGGIPFVEDQFRESMENTVSHAKVEIEAHISNTAMRIGVESMRLDAVKSAPKMIEQSTPATCADCGELISICVCER